MIYTIGHSTRTTDLLLGILNEYGIEQVVDVRTLPYSKYNPQFNKETFAETLEANGIKYVHMKELGGLRHPRKDSVNLGWKNASFRGYADYMQTKDFTEGIRNLIKLSKGKCTAIMCAEAVPWRCHRSLIADALSIRKVKVIHILSEKSARRHELTPFAKVEKKTITHPKQK